MAGNRDGTSERTTASILGQFMVAPLDMSMTMHMGGLMYAPSDAVTLMAMANWIDNVMNHETRMGMGFAAESSGLGDASLGALIGLKSEGSTRLHLNAGLSFPVGSIDRTGVTPMSGGNAVQLPYPMQLGSGTWDVTPGITVLGMSEGWSWGFQACDACAWARIAGATGRAMPRWVPRGLRSSHQTGSACRCAPNGGSGVTTRATIPPT